MLLKSLLIVSLHCACGLRLPESAHINTPSVAEQLPAESVISTDLVAPAASSLSQYYQKSNYPNLPYFEALQHAQQQAQQHALQRAHQKAHAQAPFLYNGPLIMMVHPGDNHEITHHLIIQPKEAKNTEKSSADQEPNTYTLYRPAPQDNPQFVDMFPPSEDQEEPDYYAVKPRKTKKYSEVYEKKQKKYSKGKNIKKEIVDDVENEYTSQEEDVYSSETPPMTDDTGDTKANDEADSNVESEKSDSVETSAPSSRLDFQMHGHRGPKTYKFGYDTGKGLTKVHFSKNRQFKLEELDEHGDLYGQYGFYDDKGKLRVVKYSSLANDGFKVL